MLSKLEAEITRKRKAYQKLGDEIGRLVDKRDKMVLKAQQNEPWGIEECLVVYDEFGREDQRSYEFIKQLPAYKNGVGFDGTYWPNTNQRTVSIRIDRGGDLDRIEALIRGILPFVKPCTTTGERIFDLLEPTLSENGIYYVVEQNNRWSLNLCRYGHDSTLVGPTDLTTLLKHIEKHHGWPADRRPARPRIDT